MCLLQAMSGVSYYSQLMRERSERTDRVEVVAHEAVKWKERRLTQQPPAVFLGKVILKKKEDEIKEGRRRVKKL